MSSYTASKPPQNAGASVNVVRDYVLRGRSDQRVPVAPKRSPIMNRLDDVESLRPVSRWWAYTWGVLAVLTCPCHLPLQAVLLAGTTAGAFIGEHWAIAAIALAGLFAMSLARAVRAFRGRA